MLCDISVDTSVLYYIIKDWKFHYRLNSGRILLKAPPFVQKQNQNQSHLHKTVIFSVAFKRRRGIRLIAI